MFKILTLCALVGIASVSALRPQAVRQLGGPAKSLRAPASPFRVAQAPAYHAPASHNSGSDDFNAEVKSIQSDVRADGFEYAFDTSNNIHVVSSGDEQGNMQGGFEYISPEGVNVKLSYIADENGYQPSSDLLPTPPPIPDYILRSLEYIRTHTKEQPAQASNVYKNSNSNRNNFNSNSNSNRNYNNNNKNNYNRRF